MLLFLLQSQAAMEDFWNDIVIHGNVADSDDNEDVSLLLEHNGNTDSKENCGDKKEDDASFLRVDGPVKTSSNRSVRKYIIEIFF